MTSAEKKLAENEKKRRLKFLEDYFSLCLEHGYSVDWEGDTPPTRLVVKDYPGQSYSVDAWGAYKKELRESV